MFPTGSLPRIFALALLLSAPASFAVAQQPAPPPVADRDAQDEEKVFTEEVRVPVFATDEEGRFDPTLERDDVLVIEDGVPQ